MWMRGVRSRPRGQPACIRASSVDPGASAWMGYPAQTPLQEVPDVQAAPHGVGDALLEAEPDVAPAHRSAHAPLGRVRLGDPVLCAGHTVAPPPGPARPPSPTLPPPRTCAGRCCSPDHHTAEEVPLGLKEAGWSGRWGQTHVDTPSLEGRAQRPSPRRRGLVVPLGSR